MLKELNSLVELFKLTLARKWRERERKHSAGTIYTLPECNPLSPSRGRPPRACESSTRDERTRRSAHDLEPEFGHVYRPSEVVLVSVVSLSVIGMYETVSMYTI